MRKVKVTRIIRNIMVLSFYSVVNSAVIRKHFIIKALMKWYPCYRNKNGFESNCEPKHQSLIQSNFPKSPVPVKKAVHWPKLWPQDP